MVDKLNVSVSQDELDELLASLDVSDHASAFGAGLQIRKKTIVDILEGLNDDPVGEHVSQGELDELLETADTVKMSRAEIVDAFGREALRAALDPDSSKIMSPDFFKSLSLEPPLPRQVFFGQNLFGSARTLIRKILPTHTRGK